MPAEEDVQRILSLLKRAIRSSGSSQKEVDRQIGVQPGYLSQVMIGRLDLKLKHLLRVLDAIHVDPAGFFQLAFAEEGGGPSLGGDVLLLVPPAQDSAPGSVFPSGTPTDHELQQMVARALVEELKLDPTLLR